MEEIKRKKRRKTNVLKTFYFCLRRSCSPLHFLHLLVSFICPLFLERNRLFHFTLFTTCFDATHFECCLRPMAESLVIFPLKMLANALSSFIINTNSSFAVIEKQYGWIFHEFIFCFRNRIITKNKCNQLVYYYQCRDNDLLFFFSAFLIHSSLASYFGADAIVF